MLHGTNFVLDLKLWPRQMSHSFLIQFEVSCVLHLDPNPALAINRSQTMDPADLKAWWHVALTHPRTGVFEEHNNEFVIWHPNSQSNQASVECPGQTRQDTSIIKHSMTLTRMDRVTQEKCWVSYFKIIT